MRCCPKCSRPGPVSAFGEVRFEGEFGDEFFPLKTRGDSYVFRCSLMRNCHDAPDLHILHVWCGTNLREFSLNIFRWSLYNTFQQPFSKCCHWPWFHPKNCSTTGTKMKQSREGCWFKPTKSKRPWVFAQKHRRFFCIFQGWNIVFTWMQPPTRWSPELTLRRENRKNWVWNAFGEW